MVIPSLPVGGAEWAFVRQANALAAAGHRITCYVPYANESAPALITALDTRVRRVSLPRLIASLHRYIYKLTLLWPRANLEQRLHNFMLRRLHQRYGFDAVNPHLHSGTQMTCRAFATSAVPIIESDHGDYALLMQPGRPLAPHQPVLDRLDGMICPTQINQDRIAALPWRNALRSRVIPYAYTPPSVPVAPALPAQGIFTFGMVSRGVPEKGWQEALEAFALVQQQTTQPCRLVLVGGGAYLQALQQQLSATLRPHIHFAGAQADPRPWIESFDVALLPSYFAAESLPNVIIECLAQGKPVIATRIGGIPDMLNTPNGPCGLLVPLNAETQRAEVPALAHAMRQLMTNPDQRQALAERAPLAVARYHPHVITSALADFIQQLAAATVRPSAAPSLTQALVA